MSNNNKELLKVIRDGKVAVLYHPNYGTGWYTWNSESPEIIFHPKIVELVEQDRGNEITSEWCEVVLGIKDVYCGCANGLEIKWVPVGTKFIINEYDGNESIELLDDITFHIA